MAKAKTRRLNTLFERTNTLRLIGLIIVVLFILWQLSSLNNQNNNVLSRIDSVLYDWRFQAFTPHRSIELPIVIIDIDELTQINEGRWPWDRSKVAKLIDNLHGLGALIIGFDMVFSESVSNPIEQIISSVQIDATTKSNLIQQKDNFDGDLILANTLDPSITLGFFLHNDGYSTGELPEPLAILNEDEIEQSNLIAMPHYTANLAIFTDTKANGGFVVAVPDADGIIRRAPLLMRHEQNIYPSLSLEITRQALGIPWINLKNVQVGKHQIISGIGLGNKVFIPLDENGSILVPYKGPAQSFTTISATKILQDELSSEEQIALNNSIVLVGTSALGLKDLRSTPIQTNYPGVEVHANILDTLLQASLGENTLYLRPDWLAGATIIIMLIFGVILAVFLPKKSPQTTIISTLLGIAIIISLNLWLWHYQHMDFPLAAPVLMTASIAIINIIFAYLIANKQRNTIHSLFSEYVPIEHVNRMISNPNIVGTDGEQREMTVFFADVRNFTNISEQLSPNQLKQILNNYLSNVTKIIFDHSGTVDKYVGDMVMAFWNAPLDDADHANNAVKTAIDMQGFLIKLRTQLISQGLPEFHVGIGINTGTMHVGDMGSEYRRAYTVIGDAVNLASRLESLTAYYKLPILVSEFTRDKAPNFTYRLVDKVQVKGRQQAVDIYQPICEHCGYDDLELYIQEFEQAVQNYRQRNWQQAKIQFNTLMNKQIKDRHLCAIYLARMADLDPADLPANWQAIYVPGSK